MFASPCGATSAALNRHRRCASAEGYSRIFGSNIYAGDRFDPGCRLCAKSSSIGSGRPGGPKAPHSLRCFASVGAPSNSTRTTSRPELAQCGQSSRRFIRKSIALRLAPSVTIGSVQKIQNDSPKMVAMRCFSRFSEPFERDVARSRYRPVRGQAMRAWLARAPQRSHRHGHHLSPRTQYR